MSIESKLSLSGAPDVCDLSYGSSTLLSKCTGGFRMKK